MCMKNVYSNFKFNGFTQVVLVSSVAYAAGVMTMVGSTVLVSTLSSAIAMSGPTYYMLPTPPQIKQPKPICNETEFHAHITEQPGNTLLMPSEQPKSDQSDGNQHPGYGVASFLSTVLSQLLAVCTMKSSVFSPLVKSRFGSSDNLSNYETETAIKSLNPRKFCAMGPCVSSNLGLCENITTIENPSTLAFGGHVTEDCMTDRTQLQCRSCEQRMEGERGQKLEPWPMSVKCCCASVDSVITANPVQVPVKDRFSDLSVGFVTSIDFLPLVAVCS